MEKIQVALILLIPIIMPLTKGDLVTDTCQKSPNPKLCVSVLRADPRSKTADVAGLGLIVVDTLNAKAVSILDQINKLLPSNPKLKAALSECAENYNAIIKADIPQAKEALTKGDPKFAEGGFTDAAFEANLCEEGFAPSRSPLTASNNKVRDLGGIGEAIVKLLL